MMRETDHEWGGGVIMMIICLFIEQSSSAIQHGFGYKLLHTKQITDSKQVLKSKTDQELKPHHKSKHHKI